VAAVSSSRSLANISYGFGEGKGGDLDLMIKNFAPRTLI
jgi:hypothetical protein